MVTQTRTALLGLPLLFLAAHSSALTLNVPDTYPTIQAAINAAGTGDTVLVRPGYYPENLYIDKTINLTSINPTDPNIVNTTVIDAHGAIAGVLCVSPGATISPTVRGFTIARGMVGADCGTGSAPVMEHNVFVANTSSSGGGGIICTYQSQPTIRYNTIEANVAALSGGGIYCGAGSNPTIEHNVIGGNYSGTEGGGIEAVGISGSIRYNVIVGNFATTYGGGITCFAGNPAISNNIIADNVAAYGGGVVFSADTTATFTNNTLSGNSAYNLGGGVACLSSTTAPTIANCIIAFSGSGGGIVLIGQATPPVSYSDVYSNTGGEYVGFAPSGPGNISAIPYFANRGRGDYHLQSEVGRWDPLAQAWVIDATQSPCIDAGDPASAYSLEPAPNGSRINMGAYGDTPEASKSLSPMPDVLVRNLADAAFIGSGVYNTTGAGQTKAQTVANAVKATYVLRLQNHGLVSGTFKVTGTAGSSSFVVAYFDAASGGSNITGLVAAAGWTSPVLAPAGTKDLRVEVTPAAATAGGVVKDVLVTAQATLDATKQDAVKASTTVATVHKPDALIKNSADASWLGDNIYNATGVGQTKAQSVSAGAAAVYHLRVQNDGNAPEAFNIIGPAGSLGWTVEYFSALSGGSNITAQVTGAGWLTPVVAKGATLDFRVEVKPDSTVVVSDVRNVLVTMRSSADLTKLDAVKAATTKK